MEYLHQAGKKAASRSATREAIVYFEQALDALKHLPESRQTLEKAISLRVDFLGPSLISTKGFGATEVEQVYTRARVLCEQLGENSGLKFFRELLGLARMHDVRGS